MRKRRTRGHVIADLGVNHVERQVLLAGHVMQPIVRDYGIDLSVFTFGDAGVAESGQFLVQVKSTDSPDRDESSMTIRFWVERAHLLRWLDEADPVVLVVYDAAQDVAYWLHVQEYLPNRPRSRISEFSTTLTLRIPIAQLLTPEAVDIIRARKNRLVPRRRQEVLNEFIDR